MRYSRERHENELDLLGEREVTHIPGQRPAAQGTGRGLATGSWPAAPA